MEPPQGTRISNGNGVLKSTARFERLPRENPGAMTKFVAEGSQRPQPKSKKSDPDLQSKLDALIADLTSYNAAKQQEETPPDSIRADPDPEPVETVRSSDDLWENMLNRIKRRKCTTGPSLPTVDVRRDPSPHHPKTPLDVLVEDMVKSKRLKDLANQEDCGPGTPHDESSSGNVVSRDPDLSDRQRLLESINRRRAELQKPGGTLESFSEKPAGDCHAPRESFGNYRSDSSGNLRGSQGNRSSFDSANLRNDSNEERKTRNDVNSSLCRDRNWEGCDPNKSGSVFHAMSPSSSRSLSTYGDPKRFPHTLPENVSNEKRTTNNNNCTFSRNSTTFKDYNPGTFHVDISQKILQEDRKKVNDIASNPSTSRNFIPSKIYPSIEERGFNANSRISYPNTSRKPARVYPSIDARKFDDMNASFSKNLSIAEDSNPRIVPNISGNVLCKDRGTDNNRNSSLSLNPSTFIDPRPPRFYHNTSEKGASNYKNYSIYKAHSCLEDPILEKFFNNNPGNVSREEEKESNDINCPSSRKSSSLTDSNPHIPAPYSPGNGSYKERNSSLSLNPYTLTDPLLSRFYSNTSGNVSSEEKKTTYGMNSPITKNQSTLKDPGPVISHYIPGNVPYEDKIVLDISSSSSRNHSVFRDSNPEIPSPNTSVTVSNETKRALSAINTSFATSSQPSRFYPNIPGNVSTEESGTIPITNASFSREVPIDQNPEWFHPKTFGNNLTEERRTTKENPSGLVKIWSNLSVNVLNKDRIRTRGGAICTDAPNRNNNFGSERSYQDQQVPGNDTSLNTTLEIQETCLNLSMPRRLLIDTPHTGRAPSDSSTLTDLTQVTSVPACFPNDDPSIFTDPDSGKTYANLDNPPNSDDPNISQPLNFPIDTYTLLSPFLPKDQTSCSALNTWNSQGSNRSFIFDCGDIQQNVMNSNQAQEHTMHCGDEFDVPQSNESPMEIPSEVEMFENIGNLHRAQKYFQGSSLDVSSYQEGNVHGAQNNIGSFQEDQNSIWQNASQSNTPMDLSSQVDINVSNLHYAQKDDGSYQGVHKSDYPNIPHSNAPMDISFQGDIDVGNYNHAQKNFGPYQGVQKFDYPNMSQTTARMDILSQGDINVSNFHYAHENVTSFHGDERSDFPNVSQSNAPSDISFQRDANVGNFPNAQKNVRSHRGVQKLNYPNVSAPTDISFQEDTLRSNLHPIRNNIDPFHCDAKWDYPNTFRSNAQENMSQDVGNFPHAHITVGSLHSVENWVQTNAPRNISYQEDMFENFEYPRKVQTLKEIQVSSYRGRKDVSSQEDMFKSQMTVFDFQSQSMEKEISQRSKFPREGSQSILENFQKSSHKGFPSANSQESCQSFQASQRSNYSRSNAPIYNTSAPSLSRSQRTTRSVTTQRRIAYNENNRQICQRFLLNEHLHNILSSNFEKCQKAQPVKTLKPRRSLRIFTKNGFKIYKLNRIRKKVPRTVQLSFDDLYQDMSQGNAANFDTFSLRSVRTNDSYEPDDGTHDDPGEPEERLSKVERKLRRGLNHILRNKSLLPSQEYRDDPPEDDVNSKIQNLLLVIYDDLQRERPPVLSFRKTDLRNCVLKDNMLQLKPDAAITRIDTRKTRSHRLFMVILYVMKVVLDLFDSGLKLSKRELYYMLKHVVVNEGDVSRAIDCLCHVLNVGMWSLNIFAQKGMVYGNMKLVMSQGEVINCNVPGTLIPMDVDDIVEIHSKATFILVVEKAAIFHKLIDEGLPGKLTRPFILITGKGYPDLNTQRFLRKIWRIMSLPIFILVDADPHGIKIMMNYRFGSVRNAHVSHHLAVPNASWLGVFPSEIAKYQAKSQKMTATEEKIVMSLLSYPRLSDHPRLLSELRLLSETRTKAGIEGLLKSDVFLSEVYLPTKFYSQDFA